MQKKILVRSVSDSHLVTRSLCKPHAQRIQNQLLIQQQTRLKKEEEVLTSATEISGRNYGSYWSPAVSEIDMVLEPLGPANLKRQAQLQTLIFTLINACIISTQTLFIAVVSPNHPAHQLISYVSLALFYSLAFITATFAPVILQHFPKTLVLVAVSVASTTYASSHLLPHIAILLPISAVSGALFGLMSVLQGTCTLNLGLQYACVKNMKRKTTAGDWYLWTQVVVQCGMSLGSMVSSGGKMWLMPDTAIWDEIRHPLDAQRQCGGKRGIVIFADNDDALAAAAVSPSLNRTFEAEDRTTAVMDNQWQIWLFLILACLALSGTLLAGVSFCFSRARSRNRRGNRNRQYPAPEEELLSVSETTQIYTESTIRQLRNLGDILLYNHKLQFILPLCLLMGMQSAFITTTFPKNIVACALSPDYVGWTLAAHYGMTAISTIITYRLISQVKRLRLLTWLTLFHVGMGAVVIVWQPGNHDVAIFFIIAGVFGVTEGGFNALLSGLIARVFSHEWMITCSFLTSFKFAGWLLGICSALFVGTTVQMYLILAVLILALVPFAVLEWKYDNFLKHRLSKETFL